MSQQPLTLTPEEIQARFPRASKSTLAANAVDPCTVRKVAAQLRVSEEDARRHLESHVAVKTDVVSVAKPKRAGRKPGVMNQTEAEFYAMLQRRMAEGEFVSVEFEAVTLKVGEPCCRYTGDFACFTPEGRLQIFETKGAHVFGDSVVKVKAAVRQYPAIHFEIWQRARNRDGGAWAQIL